MGNSVEESPSQEASSSSDSQEYPKSSCRSYKIVTGIYPEPDELSPKNPILFIDFHFNIILLSTSRSSKRYLFILFSHQNPVCIYILITCVSYAPPISPSFKTYGYPPPIESLNTPGLTCNKACDYCGA